MWSYIFCVGFFCEDLAIKGVWVSMDCLLPGYSDDRAFGRMELHQPVSLPPPVQSLKVFLELSAVVFYSEGEVYDSVISKQSD